MPLRPAVVVVRPQKPGNIGSISRAMSNFGFTDLRLVQPPPGWRTDDEALRMASGHDDAMQGAREYPSLEALRKEIQSLVGFCRRAGARRPILGTLDDCALYVDHRVGLGGRVGLVFGNERTGLDMDEIAHCDALFTIKTTEESGSLNLAMAVAVVLYDLGQALSYTAMWTDVPNYVPPEPVSLDRVDDTVQSIVETMAKSGVYGAGPDSKENATVYLRRILARAQLSEFEVDYLKRMSERLRKHVQPNAEDRTSYA